HPSGCRQVRVELDLIRRAGRVNHAQNDVGARKCDAGDLEFARHNLSRNPERSRIKKMRVGFGPGRKAEPVRSWRSHIRPLPFVHPRRVVQLAGAQAAGAFVVRELHSKRLAGPIHKGVVARDDIGPLAIAFAADAQPLRDSCLYSSALETPSLSGSPAAAWFRLLK